MQFLCFRKSQLFFILPLLMAGCDLASSMQLTKRPGCLKGNCYYGTGIIRIGDTEIDGLFTDNSIHFKGAYKTPGGDSGNGVWEIRSGGEPVKLTGNLVFVNGDAGEGDWSWDSSSIGFSGTRIFRNRDTEEGSWTRAKADGTWSVSGDFADNTYRSAGGAVSNRYYLKGKPVSKAVYVAAVQERERLAAIERERERVRAAEEAEFKRVHGNDVVVCNQCGGTGGKTTRKHYDPGGKSNCRYETDVFKKTTQVCDYRDSSWSDVTSYCGLCGGAGKIWKHPKYHNDDAKIR